MPGRRQPHLIGNVLCRSLLHLSLGYFKCTADTFPYRSVLGRSDARSGHGTAVRVSASAVTGQMGQFNRILRLTPFSY
jgi:hypothetical protein